AVKYTMNYTEYIPPEYMQDFTLEKCMVNVGTNGNPADVGDEITVYDRRDGSDYTVRYINGACWMTQNLRITGTISSTDSNFSTKSTWNVHVSDLTAGNSYTQARSHVPTATDADTSGNKPMDTYTANQLGVWYNYCAASAGTVCSQTKLDASEDICPSGWHLPSYNTAPGAFSGMTGTVTTTGTNNASYFSPIYGGYYYLGSLYYATTYRHWWSATARDANIQHYLYYSNGSLSTHYGNKGTGGYHVRCVRTS
ncbi:hypothetical protein IJG04_02565, partial [Candidatus Saccharibacteria bacterium]|nr:hypothetical protein [Candidatus Saccharibacteria bacterium]